MSFDFSQPTGIMADVISFFKDFFTNPVMLSALLAWGIAQTLKMPIDYFLHKRWNWSLLFSAGGMPSSHSALVTATTLAIGIFDGVKSSTFALAFVLSMIVIYDATGIRRQAGIHAQKINVMINELLAGHPLNEERLAEVLGHTPRQAVGGMGIGILCAILVWFLLR